MRRFFIALIVSCLSLLTNVPKASAFEVIHRNIFFITTSANEFDNVTHSLGSNCTVSLSLTFTKLPGFAGGPPTYLHQTAVVALQNANDRSFPEGTFFKDNRIRYGQSITKEKIESCFPGNSSVSNLTQDGASGGFDKDNYMGFSFVYEGDTYVYALEVKGSPTDNEIAARVTNLAPVPTLGPLTRTTDPMASPITYTSNITVDEDVTGFTVDDLIVVNATAKLTGSGKNFVATITPISDGPVAMVVPVAAFRDLDGRTNDIALSVVTTHDGTKPVAILYPFVSGVGVYTSRIILTEETDNLSVDDLTVTNGTVTLTGAALVYTATVTPTLSGQTTLTIAKDKFTDSAGNLNYAANTVSASYVDLIRPSLSLSALTSNNGTFSSVITLSEPATNFTQTDLVVTNGTAELSGSGANYTAIVTPSVQGPVNLSVAQNSFADAAGNLNLASSQVTALHDTIRPTVTLGSFVPDGVRYTVPVTLSENSTDFTIGDLTVTNGTVNLSGAGKTYIATVSPTNTGVTTLTVLENEFTDGAGNNNLAAKPVDVYFTDFSRPTASFGSIQPVYGCFGRYELEIMLSEPSPNFSAADITADNAEVSSVFGSGVSYTAVYRRNSTGNNITFSIADGTFTDLSGNLNFGVTKTTVNPTAKLNSLTYFPEIDGYITSMYADQPVLGLNEQSVTLTNGDFEIFENPGASTNCVYNGQRNWGFWIKPRGPGPVTLTIPAGSFSNITGDKNLHAMSASSIEETIRPTIALGVLTLRAGVFTSNITLSEKPTDFTAADLDVSSNGSATLSGSGLNYTATITPTDSGTIELAVPENSFTDIAGNFNTAARPVSVIYDGTGPTITLGDLILGLDQYTATITLSELPTGFSGSDLDVGNGTATLSGSGTNYIATIIPTTDGSVTLAIAKDKFTDAVGNLNTAAIPVSAIYDVTQPVIAAIDDITQPAGAGLTTANVSFSTSVSDNFDTPSSFTPVFKADGTTIASPHDFPMGETIVSVSANADNGGNNPDTITFKVIVKDNEKPIIAPIADINLPTGTGLSTLNVSFGTEISDNVDTPQSFTPQYALAGVTIASPYDFPTGINQVTVTATADSSGNVPEAITFLVTVIDTEMPVFSGVPANMNFTADVGASTKVATFAQPTVYDVVDGAIIPFLSSDPPGLNSDSAFPVGITTLNYTATDSSGNVVTAAFSITVADVEQPVFADVPANITQNTDTGLPTATVTFIPPTAKDNVDGALAVTRTSGPASGDAFAMGTNIVTYSATDTVGNVQTASFTVTVEDDEAPMFAAVPMDIIQDVDTGQPTAVVIYTPPTATDNVDGPIVVTQIAGPASGDAFPVGTTIVTHFASDSAGNETTVDFIVTIEDEESPEIAAVSNITTKTDSGTDTASVSFTTTVADNNDAPSYFTPVFKIAQDTITSPHNFTIGVTTVIVTANGDSAGNAPVPVTFTVTVSDDEAPAFVSFPNDIVLKSDFPSTTALASWSEPTATDNASTVDITQTSGPTSGSAFPVGTTTVTYQAVDLAGNLTVQSFTVEVTAITPGTVTFVVNSEVDEIFYIRSPELVLNTAISTISGSGRSSVITLRPGRFPITFVPPNGIGVESAGCDAQSSILSAETLSGTIITSSGADITCTITVRDSVRETVAQIGQFLELRSQMILQNQPSITRRIGRLEARFSNNGSVSGFGLALKNDRIPFAVQVGRKDGSFSYSLRQSRERGVASKLSGDVIGVLSAFGISPRTQDEGISPLIQADTANAPTPEVEPIDPTTLVSSFPATRPVDLLTEDIQTQNNEPVAQPFDFWAEGKFSAFETNYGTGSFGIVHIGADYLIKPQVLLGFSVQADWTNLDGQITGSKNDGYGFLVGPYVTAKIAEGFYFDARAAWGKARNETSPFGTYTDSFASERWLASAALIGTWEHIGFNITPSARLSYFKETSEGYTDSLGVLIPVVAVETGILEFGPTISKDFASDSGLIYSPFLTVQGIWTFAEKNTATAFSDQNNLDQETFRARLEAGLGFRNQNGSSLDVSANYDGIGDKNYSSWGATLSYNFQF